MAEWLPPEALDRLVGAPILLVRLDGDGRYVAASAGLTAILGWSPDEIVGQSWKALVHPDDLESSAVALAAGRAGAATTNYINRLRTKDGDYRHIHWIATGDPTPSVIAVGIDVSERQMALEEARASDERLRSILGTAPGYVTIVSPSYEIEYINRTYPGVEVSQVIGTNLINWLAPESRSEFEAQLERVFAGEEVEPIVAIGSGADGGLTWYRTSFGALRGADGAIIAVTLYGDDVTAQMRAERMRAQVGRFEAAGRVATAVGHGLTNALMAMRTAVELIDADGDPDRRREALAVLREAITQATDLTESLGEPFGEASAPSGPLSLVRALSDLESLLRTAAGDQPTLSMSMPDGEVLTEIATSELSQIVVNLIANAREALDGTGTIEIELGRAEVDNVTHLGLKPGAYATIEVRDNGAGIPEEVRLHALDPFFTTKPSGRGVGLAICYGIVLNRGGTMELLSPSSGGTVVRVWLPRVTARGDVARRPSAGATAGPSPRATILLAEDEHLVRSAVSRYLRRLGHIVLEGRDGNDALEVARRHPGPIDVLVTDLAMPGRGGRALIAALREEQPDVPALAMTGYADSAMVAELEAIGVQTLHKPVAPRVLHDALLALIRAS